MTWWQTVQTGALRVGSSTAVTAVASTGRTEILSTSVARKKAKTRRARPRSRFVGVVCQRMRNAGVESTPACGTIVPFA